MFHKPPFCNCIEKNSDTCICIDPIFALQIEILKFITYIISFVILGSGLFPCSDTSGSRIPVSASESVTLKAADCTSQDGHSDICNPFCSCSCCGTTMTHPKLSDFTLAVLKHSTVYHEAYHKTAPESVSLPIWQPPKV